MFRSSEKKASSGGGKQKRLPVFSMALVACYLIIAALFFIYGFGDGRPAPEPLPTEPPETTREAPLVPMFEPAPVEYVAQAIPLPPEVQVKGVWLWTYSSREQIEELIDLVADENTVLNTIVLDAKNENGRVIYLSNDEFADWRPTRKVI